MTIKISKPLSYSALGNKPNQEDSVYPPVGEATEKDHVFLLCDGMGGHENGEVASACVANTIGKATSNLPVCTSDIMKGIFEKALEQAYDNLDQLDDEDSSRKMGTTLTFLAICSDGVLTAHIGDSRIYQFRPGKGIVFQTRDHSLVNDLIASGELSEAEAKTFPQRNVITRALQPHQEYHTKASYSLLTDVCKGDIFMLCCDGVLEKMDNSDLCNILFSQTTLEKRLAAIQSTCKTRNTCDNNSAYLIEVEDAENTSDVKLTKVIPDDTPDTPSDSEQAPRNRYYTWILLAVLALALVLVFIYLSTSSKNENAEPQNSIIPETEQVQGTIQRHKN